MMKGNRQAQAGATGAYFPRIRSPGQKQPAIGAAGGKCPARQPSALAVTPARPGFIAFTIDHALAAGGLGVAISSLAFAAFMIAQSNRGTRLEPRDGFGHPARSQIHLAQEPFRPLNAQSIDYNATASIAHVEAAHGVRRPGQRLNSAEAPLAPHHQTENYVISFVYNNMALVKSKHGFYAAKPGSLLPGAGRVRSIDRLGPKWILVTENTIIAEAN
jgi:hypothetical protein